jgi:hypothetical protein
VKECVLTWGDLALMAERPTVLRSRGHSSCL